MSLTNEDITKLGKTIKSIVRSEVSNETKNLKSTLTSEIKLLKFEVSNNLSAVNNRLKDLEISSANLQKDITIVKNDVKKLDKRLTRTIDFFDNAEMDTRAKVNKTRTEVGLREVEFAY